MLVATARARCIHTFVRGAVAVPVIILAIALITGIVAGHAYRSRNSFFLIKIITRRGDRIIITCTDINRGAVGTTCRKQSSIPENLEMESLPWLQNDAEGVKDGLRPRSKCLSVSVLPVGVVFSMHS